MSNKFDGVLLCVDFDGTLAWQGRISTENAASIRRFQSEGGMFTVISGRAPDFFREYASSITPNTYVCGMNGAWITDFQTGESVLEQPMEADAVYYAVTLLKKLPGVSEFHMQTKHGTFSSKIKGGSLVSPLPANINDVFKILFIVSTDESDSATKLLATEASDRFAISRSWINGLEIQRHGIDKGFAVRFLKERLAGKISCVVGVGDYENDIPLLRSSDLKVAEQDAVPAVKAVAEWVTSSCRYDSIAKVIEWLPTAINGSKRIPY